jgi:hypothetical protein
MSPRRRRRRGSGGAIAGSLVAVLGGFGCGSAIDLGGPGDDPLLEGGALDSPVSLTDGGGAACDPCVGALDCSGNTVCVRLASAADTYCGATCPSGGGCDAGETCASLTTVNGQSAKVCAPNSRACPAAVGPESDGGMLERCGALTGPSLTANCHACEYSCQTNGCYGGWWCNTTTKDCERPPSSCP